MTRRARIDNLVRPELDGGEAVSFERVVRRQRKLTDLACRALGGVRLPVLLREATVAVCEALDVECSEIFWLSDDREQLVLSAGVGWGGESIGRLRLAADLNSQAGYALISRDPVIATDLRVESRFWEATLLQHGIVSGMMVRICAGGRAVGVLGAHSSRTSEFAEEKAVFLLDVAEIIEMSVERALSVEHGRRVLEERDRRARAAEERFAFLSDATTVLASDTDLASALAATARVAVPRLADWCFVDLVQKDGEGRETIRRLTVAKTLEESEEQAGAEDLCHRHYPMELGGPHGTPKVLRTGQPELLHDVDYETLKTITRDEDHLSAIHQLSPISYICVPLRVGRRLVGTVGLVSTGLERRYGEEDLELAEGLARCAALVVGCNFGDSSGARGRREPGTTSSIASDDTPALTNRQCEVLGLLDTGVSAREISQRLVIAETTVRKHIRDLLRAFGAHSQREAIFKARRFGLL